jgi:restriction system protein
MASSMRPGWAWTWCTSRPDAGQIPPLGVLKSRKKFVGALQGQHARKGIFITTARFTLEAREYASRVDANVVLIDGETLAHLMIDYDVGVVPVADYQLKRIDYDFFNPE